MIFMLPSGISKYCRHLIPISLSVFKLRLVYINPEMSSNEHGLAADGNINLRIHVL